MHMYMYAYMYMYMYIHACAYIYIYMCSSNACATTPAPLAQGHHGKTQWPPPAHRMHGLRPMAWFGHRGLSEGSPVNAAVPLKGLIGLV